MRRHSKPIQKAVLALRNEEAEIQQRLDQVRDTIERLKALHEPAGRRSAKRGSRRLSSEGRAAISRAAKKRWAAYRRQKSRAGS